MGGMVEWFFGKPVGWLNNRESEMGSNPSLKLTFSHLKLDGWNTFSFPCGARPKWPIFRC